MDENGLDRYDDDRIGGDIGMISCEEEGERTMCIMHDMYNNTTKTPYNRRRTRKEDL